MGSNTPCNCPDCAALCKGHPGWFAPGQASKAAKELGMTLPDFIAKFLTIDYWTPDEEFDSDVYLLSPAWTVDKQGNTNAGRKAGYSEAFVSGDCALLTPTGCKLSFDTRPKECRDCYGCKPLKDKDMRRKIVRQWVNESQELAGWKDNE